MAYRLMSKTLIVTTYMILEVVVLCPCDNLILQLFGHIVEIIRVAGHAHQQITVVLRVFLGVEQRLGIYDIKLDMMTA